MKKPDVWFEKRKWKEEKRTDMGSEAKRKPGYLGRAKVRSLLLVSIVGALQDILMVTTDKLIVGNLLGADAVSGTVLISPIFTFGQTFEILVSSGASVLYARAIGNYDDEKRRRVLGMSSMLALAFGLFMCIASFVFQDMIFDALGAEGIIRTYGEEYFYFYRFTFLIIPLFSFLSEIIYIDGDELRSITSGIALLFGNAVLSFIFTKKIGMLGASLGSAIGMVLALIIVLSHFITKKNRIRPIFVFDKSDFMEILIIGGADSTSCIFESLYSFLLNMFIIRVVGEEYLTVLAVTYVIYEMMAIGGGINDASHAAGVFLVTSITSSLLVDADFYCQMEDQIDTVKKAGKTDKVTLLPVMPPPVYSFIAGDRSIDLENCMGLGGEEYDDPYNESVSVYYDMAPFESDYEMDHPYEEKGAKGLIYQLTQPVKSLIRRVSDMLRGHDPA